MECSDVHPLLSARLDGELAEDELAAVERHLSQCPSCRAHDAALLSLHRAVRVREALPVPDLRETILAGSGVLERRQRRVEALRYVAGALGVAQLILAVPELLGRNGEMGVHLSRHLGAWVFAFAAGLVVAGLQPWRARGMLPMVAVLMGVTGVTAVLDLTGGRTDLVAELGTHLLELAGLVVMWLLGRWYPMAGHADGGRRRPFRPALHTAGAGPFSGVQSLPVAGLPAMASGCSLAATANTSSSLDRETLERIVPTGQEHTSAASA